MKLYTLIHDTCTIPSGPECSHQGNIHVRESPQEQATRANHAACMYVKSTGELFMGLERGIEVEECAFHNSCTKV